MESNIQNESLAILFSKEEALVLLEWLYDFNKEERPMLFQDQAEEQILFDLESELEKIVSDTFAANYQEILLQARLKIRAKE